MRRAPTGFKALVTTVLARRGPVAAGLSGTNDVDAALRRQRGRHAVWTSRRFGL